MSDRNGVECSQIMKQFMNQKFTSPVDGVEFSMKSESQVRNELESCKEGWN